MTTHRDNNFTLVFGKKHSGKSFKSRQLVAEYPRRIIVDPMREYRDGVIVTSFADAHEYLGGVKDNARFSVILRTLDKGDEYKMIDLCLYGEPDNPLLPNTVLYLDEMDRLCGPSSLPPSMNKLANYGRHYGISLIGVARSPKKLHGDFMRNADVILVGKMNQPSDVDYLNEYIGSDLCERARALPEREFIRWDSSAPVADPELTDPNPGGPDPES